VEVVVEDRIMKEDYTTQTSCLNARRLFIMLDVAYCGWKNGFYACKTKERGSRDAMEYGRPWQVNKII
jgi:hypothetical protein